MRRFAIALVLPFLACEEPIASDSLEVIGGDAVEEGMFPATGALVVEGVVMCTGSLISPTVVLTAAHCIEPMFIGDSIPGFTLETNGNGASLGEIVEGERSVKHPSFDINALPPELGGVSQWFDIGLLVLAEPIEDVRYAVMPTVEEAARGLVADRMVSIVGYGLTENDSILSFGVKTHGQATLVEVGPYELFIGKAGEQQNCNGDSGGPAYIDIDGRTRIVGIVSRAPDQNPVCDHGGIDTRVDPYVQWVADTVPEICDDIPCDDETGLPIPPEDVDDGGCAASGARTELSSVLLLAIAALLSRRRLRS